MFYSKGSFVALYTSIGLEKIPYASKVDPIINNVSGINLYNLFIKFRILFFINLL